MQQHYEMVSLIVILILQMRKLQPIAGTWPDQNITLKGTTLESQLLTITWSFFIFITLDLLSQSSA